LNKLKLPLFQILKFLPSKIIPFFGNYIFILLVSSNLTIAEYGNYFFLLTIFTSIYTFTFSIIPQLIMRYCIDVNILQSKKFRNYFLIVLFFSFIFTIIYFLFFKIKFQFLFLSFFYVLSYSLIEIILALCRTVQNELTFNLTNIARSLLPILFLTSLNFYNMVNIKNIFLVFIGTNFLLSLFYLKYNYKFEFKNEIELNIKEFFLYYFNLSIITGSLFLNSKINFLISKNFIDNNSIGQFSFNFDFFEKFLQNITSMLNIAFTVTAFSLYDKKNISELKSFLKNNLLIYIFITLPIILFFIFFNEDLFTLIDKKLFLLDLVNLIYLLFSFFFIGLGHRFSIVFLVTNSTNVLAQLTFVTLIFSVILNYLLIKHYSISGLYITQFFSSLFWLLLLYFFSRKKINFLVN